MDVLGSRMLLRSVDPARGRRFYRDVLGLAVYREFGDPDDPSLVFFLGGGFLEVSGGTVSGGTASGGTDGPAGGSLSLWLQVRDVDAEHERLTGLGVVIARPPKTEPWGLREMWISDPDGVRIVLVEVPADHPLRRDRRGTLG
ncbi:MAG TPA: VOC family protein [Pseudonocardiaceae bacterium]|jgi:catechol 2,3-dioxygenase-like lactoylglutathione lyase family enzyme|nr:VOC family protein [Pseudonocardiaceae bacterium]